MHISGEFCAQIAVLVGLGAFVGYGYVKRAMLEVKLASTVATMFGLALLAALVFWTADIEKGFFASMMIAGICLPVYWRALKLVRLLPVQFTQRLNGLSGHEGVTQPRIYGHPNVGWSLVYDSGTNVQYDLAGKIKRLTFPDGTYWNLSDQPEEADDPFMMD